ncbi:MAG: two-component system cell cycle sensor histidine kinase/response regulator CckA [Paracoccaceae bacterium]
MADQAIVPEKLALSFWGKPRQHWVMLGFGAICTGLAWIAPVPQLSLGLFFAAGAVVATAVLLNVHSTRLKRVDRRALVQAGSLIDDDPAPCFCTDRAGAIVFQNQAATARFGPRRNQPMSRALAGLFLNAPAVVFRQEAALSRARFSRESVVSRKGQVRVTAHRVGTGTLWRLDENIVATKSSGDGISLPMMVVSHNDTILSMNDVMRATLGRRAKSLSEVFTNLPLSYLQQSDLCTERGKIAVTVLEVDADDGRREIYALPLHHGGEVDTVAARAFEALPVALVHVSASGNILASNRQAQALLDLKPGETVPLSSIVEGLGRPVNDWLTDTLEERIPNRPEVVRARRKDEDQYLQITLGRVTGAEGKSLLAVLHDATELKTLEQQFVQSQKMQAIGQLAGGVAHDFNNLLTAISGHCDLLMLRHDRGDPDFADLIQINQNANRAASLVGQLLAFSRKQTLEPEVLDLRETMGELTHLLNRLVGEKVRLQLSHDPALLPIRADRRQLDQVLMNLAVNARDAMPDGGRINVETLMVHLTEELHRDQAVVPPGHYVTISVRDCGIGIPPDKLTRIFEPFYTTKRPGEGTGLGLSMAYGIVKQTGGYIFVDSVVGKGTTFTIFCPAYDMPLGELATVAKAPESTARDGFQGPAEGVVLLVEDEAPVRAFASRALRLRGYTVLEAENAEDALKKLEDINVQVDIFVTDVVMPGMDGPSWVREALKTRPNVKVVFVSGYAEDAFEKSGEKIPNSVFLPKPFSLSELTSTVQRQLH